MVASVASRAGYIPADVPEVAVAHDGTLAAIVELSRITIVELPAAVAFAEIAIDPEALGSDVAWLGSPPRLLVVSRYAASSSAHLIDPDGPRTIAEIWLELPVTMVASVGTTALIVGAQIQAALLTSTESHLTLYQFPTRAMPRSAGAAGGHFMVAFSAAIEEWDPQSRTPRRRLRFPRVASTTAVGGSERVVWMTTQLQPARLDVIALVNRGQPRAHDLPEPIARVISHPRSDIVACIGAESGQLYAIDLDRRAPPRRVDTGLDRIASAGLVVGRTVDVLVAQAQCPLVLVPLQSRDLEIRARAAAAQPLVADTAAVPDGARPRLDDPGDVPAPLASEAAVASEPPSGDPAATVLESPVAAPGSQTADLRQSSVARMMLGDASLAHGAPMAWREPSSRGEPASDHRATAPLSWRGDIVDWYRAVAAGELDSLAPEADLVDALIARFELAPALQPAVVLLYAAHLCGHHGVAPVDLAQLPRKPGEPSTGSWGDPEPAAEVCGWDEALGRGELAARGLAVHASSRVMLSATALRVLDELPPTTGALVGEPGAVALLGPCVVVAGGAPLGELAGRLCARVGGAILVAGDRADRAGLFAEARAYGAVVMLRLADGETVSGEPAILVVDDGELAERLALPRLD